MIPHFSMHETKIGIQGGQIKEAGYLLHLFGNLHFLLVLGDNVELVLHRGLAMSVCHGKNL